MPISPFDLIREADNATSSLAAGVSSLATRGWSVEEHAGTFTNLAVGIERMAKLSIGMSALDETGTWRSPHGHAVAELCERLDGLLDERLSKAASPVYISSLLKGVRGDLALPLIIATMDAWAATTGRYGVLDRLNGKAFAGPSPEELWQEAEQAAMTPTILAALPAPDGSGVVALREELAGSLLRWWFLIYRAWAHGVFGPHGRQMSSELDPKRPQPSRALATRLLAGR